MTCDYRLKKEKEFNFVFKKGSRLYSKNITLVYAPAQQLKAGFAVSKKHGGAVKRNKIKRYLREAFRSFTPSLRKNFFFVFIPKVAEDYSFADFKESMQILFEKGGFLV